MDQAVTLYGTLRVGAMRENGYIVGIYQLDGEKMQGPPGT
jgi:nitrate reductase NapE component